MQTLNLLTFYFCAKEKAPTFPPPNEVRGASAEGGRVWDEPWTDVGWVDVHLLRAARILVIAPRVCEVPSQRRGIWAGA